MTEICEKVAIATPPKAEKEPEEKEKKPIKVRLAIFFDGTLNNRTNIEAREQNTQHYLDHTKAGSSFENGRTNVAIMETHMKEEVPSEYDLYKSMYVPGQGTFDLEGDSLWGYALAIGDSGVPERAKLGVQKALSALTGFDSSDFDPEKHYFEKITIDVFGFSRGAATARYAIYLLLKDKNSLAKRLEAFGYEVDESVVEVGFAGIYDTVLSYLASQKFKSSNNRLEQTAHKYANKVLHLASAEEHRADFPLHNIKASKCKGGEEYYLPGVHSDVGGSYNKADPSKELMLTNSEDLTLNKGTLWKMEADKKWLIEQGWYRGIPDVRDEAVIKSEARTKIRTMEKQKKYHIAIRDGEFTINCYFRPNNQYHMDVVFAYATLDVERSGIHSAFSNIPLKIMADYVEKEPKLAIKPKMKSRADQIIKNSNLEVLENKVLEYVGKKPSDSKAEDWIAEGDALNDFLKDYRHKHLNFSARRGIGYSPRIKDGKRTRFIYDA
ncbi:hypothetical protein CW745_15410 [Psychromonas sp. psych-6C06]|uniref:phospholipase effector Tle1 domain-containing protein n=1 Tax=Psychromonas sp. psych-6C06 TaxID=2058089 RepID=UPI000C33FBEA|nr:DUF2235 domain-containing protein [Psychromonas sp. psych-6C06]PKF60331.1 hypothetical protein CW745_15410 [Psychromonas sp. psych-6C06]